MRVSIGVPIYRVEDYIERCARSLFAQTYHNIEYIFVNDSTPDKSMEVLLRVLEDYPERKKDVKIYNNEKNVGLAQTRNRIISYCSGDFIYNIDSDDYIELNTIELLVRKQEDSEADIVTADMIINENTVNPNYITPFYQSIREMLLDLLSQVYHHELCGRLIRKSLFDKLDVKAVEGHDIGEDWLVTPKLVYYSKRLAFVRGFLYHYNFQNVNSYMYNYNKAENKKKLNNKNIQTLLNLKAFFYSKNEKEFCSVLSEYILKLISKGINLSLETNDKMYYYIMLDYLYSMEDGIKNKFWGNNPIKEFIKKNFTLYFCYYKLKKILS